VLVAVIGLALNVALNVLLIPRLATTGAALSSSFAYSAMGIALLLAFRRESQLTWRQIARPCRDDWKRYTDVGLLLQARLQRQPSAVVSAEGQREG
jgi:Na+-driven multidrug efflux pump